MFHRGFHLGRVLLLALILFGGMAAGRSLYRSGFEDGFVRGMAFTAGNGDTDGPATGGVAGIPPAYVARGPWRGHLGPVEGGFLRFGFLGVALLGFGFLAFIAMLFMTAARRHHWAHYGSPGRHGPPGRHCHPGRHGHHGPGPEKRPEDFV